MFNLGLALRDGSPMGEEVGNILQPAQIGNFARHNLLHPAVDAHRYNLQVP